MSPSNPFRRGATTVGPVMLAAAWLAETPRGFGQDAAPDRKEVKGKWFPLFQKQASEYVVRVGQEAAEARMLPEPVLRWQQPVRGGDDGALYLWVRDGRPVAAVTFFTFKWPDGVRLHQPRTAFVRDRADPRTWRDRIVWKTSRPGLTFKPVPDAPAPAAAAGPRLRQMQAIVRDFTANTVDDKGLIWPLPSAGETPLPIRVEG